MAAAAAKDSVSDLKSGTKATLTDAELWETLLGLVADCLKASEALTGKDSPESRSPPQGTIAEFSRVALELNKISCDLYSAIWQTKPPDWTAFVKHYTRLTQIHERVMKSLNDRPRSAELIKSQLQLYIDVLRAFEVPMDFYPTTDQVDAIAAAVKVPDHFVLEMAAGTGIMAQILRERALKVVAYELKADHETNVQCAKLFGVPSPVKADALVAVKTHAEDIKAGKVTLALFNPPPDTEFAAQLVTAFEGLGGTRIIVGGPREFCATPTFWKHINTHYASVNRVTHRRVFYFVPPSEWECEIPLEVFERKTG